MIAHDKEANIKVDERIRRDVSYPAGFMGNYFMA